MMTKMTDLKIGSKIEMMLNDDVITGKVTDISTRETDREFWEYYTVKLDQEGWSLSFSHVTEIGLKSFTNWEVVKND